VHCYKPDMRARVQAVMRYAGPRMLTRHPVMGLRHVVKSLKGSAKPRRGEWRPLPPVSGQQPPASSGGTGGASRHPTNRGSSGPRIGRTTRGPGNALL